MMGDDFEHLARLASQVNMNESNSVLNYASALDHFGFSEANRYFSILIDANPEDVNILGGYIRNEGITEDNNSYFFRMIPYGSKFLDCRLLIRDRLYCQISEVDNRLRVSEESFAFPANSKLLFSLFRRLYLLRVLSHPVVNSCVSDLRDFLETDSATIGTKLNFSRSDVLISHTLPDYDYEIISAKVPKFKEFNSDLVALQLAKLRNKSYSSSRVNLHWSDYSFVSALFGFGFKDAGAIFQYLAHPNDCDYVPNVNCLIDEFPCGEYVLNFGRVSDSQFAILFSTSEGDNFCLDDYFDDLDLF